MDGSVLIVGASVAGVGVLNELRRLGFNGQITLVDSDPEYPYDRPPLSKSVLTGDPSIDGVLLHQRPHYDGLKAKIIRASSAIRLDGERREVELDSGARISADFIVIATGSRARPFLADGAQGLVLTLRSYCDAMRLRALLQPRISVAIVGGGFIGAEVASSVRAIGADATIIERDPLPLERVLGTTVARRVASLHEAAGVVQVCDTGVERIRQMLSGRQYLELANGTSIEADVVVAGLGNIPNVEWAAGSGVEIDNGIFCDGSGRTRMPGIYAAGDVARWQSHDGGHARRHEHWTAAREQARIVAHAIAGAEPEKAWGAFLPYFWSDLHGRRLQALGRTSGIDDVRLAFENPDKGSFLYEYYEAGNLAGVAGIGVAGKITRYNHVLTDVGEGARTKIEETVN